MHRTGFDTGAAPDAFAIVGRLMGIHIHLAGPDADTAIHTLFSVHPHTDQAYFLEKPIECPQWADVFTKRPVDEDRCARAKDQQQELPPEQPSEGSPQQTVQQDQRNSSLQWSHRTDVLAE